MRMDLASKALENLGAEKTVRLIALSKKIPKEVVFKFAALTAQVGSHLTFGETREFLAIAAEYNIERRKLDITT